MTRRLMMWSPRTNKRTRPRDFRGFSATVLNVDETEQMRPLTHTQIESETVSVSDAHPQSAAKKKVPSQQQQQQHGLGQSSDKRPEASHQQMQSPSHQNRSGLARLAMERAAAQRSVAGSMGSLSHKCTHEHSQSRYSAPAADVSLWAAAADDAEQKARNGHTCQSYFSPDKHGWARLYTEAAKEAAEAAAAEFSPHKLIRLGLAPSHVSDAKALHMDIEELRADTRQRQSSFKHSHFHTWASF